MARKTTPISYAGLTIAPDQPSSSSVAPEPAAVPSPPRTRSKPAGTTMRDLSSPFTLYLHPDAAKALRRYALEQETKVHSLILEAVEDWFRRKGLRETVRVSAESPAPRG